MVKKLLKFFDKLEDRIRVRLTHAPVLYALVGAIGIILMWKGVEETAGLFPILYGPGSFILGTIIALMTGLLVSFFVGDSIIISGLNSEKKLADKTEAEVRAEREATRAIEAKIDHIERDLHELKKARRDGRLL